MSRLDGACFIANTDSEVESPLKRREIPNERQRRSGALRLRRRDFNTTITSTELVMVYFYSNSDKICKVATLQFDCAADLVGTQFMHPEILILAKVDCDKEGCSFFDFNVRSYPTIRVFRNGEPLRGNYEGRCNGRDILRYITKELRTPVNFIHSPSDLTKKIGEKQIMERRTIYGHFYAELTIEYYNFLRIAHSLKKFGSFRVSFGGKHNGPVIGFLPGSASSYEKEEVFMMSPLEYKDLYVWAHKNLMVHEMQSENCAELTESPYPLLILYYNPNDTSVVERFKFTVAQNMANRKHNINFAVANGLEYLDSVKKLGKDESNLPLIAIGTTANMFVFPHVIDYLIGIKLTEFVNEYDIGKLQYIASTGNEWNEEIAKWADPKERLDYVY